MSQLEHAYRFTIENGTITAVFEYEDGRWMRASLDPGETYTLDPTNNTTVIRAETKNGATKTERFTSPDNGLTYYEADSSDDSSDDPEDGSGHQQDGGDLYRFTFDSADNVTAAYKFDDGAWKLLRADANESYRVDATLGRGRVIKTETEHGQVVTDVFEDPNGDGDYTEAGSSQKLDDDVFVGTASTDVTKGGGGRDELYGNGGDDDLYGDEGDDDLFGDDGDDDLFGGTGADELYGATGDDHLNGESGDDDLNGDTGNDDLNGGEGSDDLRGGAGSDRLTGGLGKDQLTGGLGADTFTVLSKLDSIRGAGRDAITDFSASQRDRLNLTAIDANEKINGNQAFSWLGNRAFTGQAGQLRAIAASAPSGIVLQGDVNGDRVADVEISLLGLNSLAANQVLL